MQKPLLGEKIAVLVANGFVEQDLTITQKALMNMGADVRIVSMDSGLVTSWSGDGWGLNFAADRPLNEALAVDFSMLFVPGGRKSIDKLKLTAHTRRFVNSFLNEHKPVAMYADAVSLIPFLERVDVYEVSASASMQDELAEVDVTCSDAAYVISQNLMTGLSDNETREDYAAAVVEFFVSYAGNEAVAA